MTIGQLRDRENKGTVVQTHCSAKVKVRESEKDVAGRVPSGWIKLPSLGRGNVGESPWYVNAVENGFKNENWVC